MLLGLDIGRIQTEDSRGCVEILDKGSLVHLRGKTVGRKAEIGRGSSDGTCPVVALQTWLKLVRNALCPFSEGSQGEARKKALLTPFPMRRSFVYLVAMIGWFSRKMLA